MLGQHLENLNPPQPNPPNLLTTDAPELYQRPLINRRSLREAQRRSNPLDCHGATRAPRHNKRLETKGRWSSSLFPVGRSNIRHFPDSIFLTYAWSEKAREGQKDRVKKDGAPKLNRYGCYTNA
jgi:hypothetical protein